MKNLPKIGVLIHHFIDIRSSIELMRIDPDTERDPDPKSIRDNGITVEYI